MQLDTPEKLRQVGNAKYATGRLDEAIQVYLQAAKLGPQDHAPLANLAAAYFETGDYQSSISRAQGALALLPEDGASEASKQRLALRLAKAHAYLKDFDAAKEALEHASSTAEKVAIEEALQSARENCSTADDGLVRKQAVLDEPRCKPMIWQSTEQTDFGHGKPESLFDVSLFDTGRERISFFYGGIGDARNLFATLTHLADPAIRKPSQSRFHFTIVDANAATIARDLVVLLILDKYSQSIGPSGNGSKELLCALSYVYVAPLMHREFYDTLQSQVYRAIGMLQGTSAWPEFVSVAQSSRQRVLHVLHYWQLQALEVLPTSTARKLLLDQKLSANNEEEARFYPEMCRREAAFYRSTGVLLPGGCFFSSDSTKQLHSAFTSHQDGATIDDNISQSIDTHWVTNVTLLNPDREGCLRRNDSSLNLGFDPFNLGSQLPTRQLADDARLFDFVSAWFVRVGRAFKALTGIFTIEALADETLSVLERLQYSVPDSKAAKDSRTSVPTPSYDRIHLTDLPDYAGGSLQVYLHAGPALHPDKEAYVTWTCLRDPANFRTWSHYDKEYTVLSETSEIEKALAMRSDNRSYLTNESSSDFSLDFISGYRRARRRAPVPALFNELMKRGALETWLYRLFLKMSIPFVRKSPDGLPALAPLSLSVFYRVLANLHNLGYPAHWLSDVLSNILSGVIHTTARPPRTSPLVMKESKVPLTARKQSVAPFVSEMRSLAAMWQHLLNFGILSPSVPALHALRQYQLQLSSANKSVSEVEILILVFSGPELVQSEVQNLRSYLLSDEKASQDPQVVDVRDNHLQVLTTWKWNADEQLASFWLERGDVERMQEGGWQVAIWRSDTWEIRSAAHFVADVKETDGRWL